MDIVNSQLEVRGNPAWLDGGDVSPDDLCLGKFVRKIAGIGISLSAAMILTGS